MDTMGVRPTPPLSNTTARRRPRAAGNRPAAAPRPARRPPAGDHAGRWTRGRPARRPRRLALDRDAQPSLPRRVRQAVLARLHQAQFGHVKAHRHVLARLVARHLATIGRLQVERGDFAAFRLAPRDAEGAPAGPAAGLGGGIGIQPRLFGDQQVRQLTVGGGRGIDEFIGGGLAQHFADRRQQMLADDGVMLGAHAQADVLVHDARHHRRQHRWIIDLLGIGGRRRPAPAVARRRPGVPG